MSYGLVVEGVYDEPVYTELIRRIISPTVEVVTRSAGGVPQLRKLFPVLLNDLEHARGGGPVDKVLVIRDADDKDPMILEQSLTQRIHGVPLSFPRGVHFHAVRRTVETWLLADTSAINQTVLTRSGGTVPGINNALEELVDPKRVLGRMLRDAGVPYTAEVGREIAERLDLSILRTRCPSFPSFEQKVINC